MSLERFRYELRIAGNWALLVPLLATGCFAVLAVILTTLHVDHLRIAQVLTASLEMILPLVAGLLAATIASHDVAIELQLTLASNYRFTALLRLGLLAGWVACVARRCAGILKRSFYTGESRRARPLIMTWK